MPEHLLRGLDQQNAEVRRRYEIAHRLLECLHRHRSLVLRSATGPCSASPLELCANAGFSHERVVREVKLVSNTSQVRRVGNGIVQELPNWLWTGTGVRVSVHSGKLVAPRDVDLDN